MLQKPARRTVSTSVYGDGRSRRDTMVEGGKAAVAKSLQQSLSGWESRRCRACHNEGEKIRVYLVLVMFYVSIGSWITNSPGRNRVKP